MQIFFVDFKLKIFDAKVNQWSCLIHQYIFLSSSVFIISAWNFNGKGVHGVHGVCQNNQQIIDEKKGMPEIESTPDEVII